MTFVRLLIFVLTFLLSHSDSTRGLDDMLGSRQADSSQDYLTSLMEKVKAYHTTRAVQFSVSDKEQGIFNELMDTAAKVNDDGEEVRRKRRNLLPKPVLRRLIDPWMRWMFNVSFTTYGSRESSSNAYGNFSAGSPQNAIIYIDSAPYTVHKSYANWTLGKPFSVKGKQFAQGYSNYKSDRLVNNTHS